MSLRSGSLQAALALTLWALAMPACGTSKTPESVNNADADAHAVRTVKIAWEAPAGELTGYRILVDERVVSEIPPPPPDPSCSCPTASVDVPRGQHTIKVVAYNKAGQSPPSAVTVVK